MCLESGFCQSKNSINVAVKNLTDFMVSFGIYWIIGFGLMFGKSITQFAGCSEFASNFPEMKMAAFFLFQAMFCGTAATINSGAIAGRAKFSTYLIMTLVISGLVYPIFGHWVWRGILDTSSPGWLEKLGFLDFAGSTVVHSLGGWVALAAVIVIGPRHNKFSAEGRPRNLTPCSYLLSYLGIFIIALGWFGFNCGSNLKADESIAVIALNTFLSASFSGLTAMCIDWWMESSKTPRPDLIGNGLLAGLVGITAGCAYVTPGASVIIGILSGAIMLFSLKFIEKKLMLDDVVGAISVHGVCGVWGTLAVALFIKDEFLERDRITQFGVQLLGSAVCFVWTFGICWLVFKFLHDSYSLRVSLKDEIKGLNLSEHNVSDIENNF